MITHKVHSEDFDETGQMDRLFWVFSESMCHFLGFAVLHLFIMLQEQ